MAKASYFRRQAKSPFFPRSVGGKYYAGGRASWTGCWRGRARPRFWSGERGTPRVQPFLRTLPGELGQVEEAFECRAVKGRGQSWTCRVETGRNGGRGLPVCEAPHWGDSRALPFASVTVGPPPPVRASVSHVCIGDNSSPSHGVSSVLNETVRPRHALPVLLTARVLVTVGGGRRASLHPHPSSSLCCGCLGWRPRLQGGLQGAVS